MKENTIFEEVEKKCHTFVNNTSVMDKYKKREIDAYFFDRSIELDLKKAKEEGIEQGEKNKAISMARNMKKDKVDFNTISKYTG